jgi:hypothetical protein
VLALGSRFRARVPGGFATGWQHPTFVARSWDSTKGVSRGSWDPAGVQIRVNVRAEESADACDRGDRAPAPAPRRPGSRSRATVRRLRRAGQPVGPTSLSTDGLRRDEKDAGEPTTTTTEPRRPSRPRRRTRRVPHAECTTPQPSPRSCAHRRAGMRAPWCSSPRSRQQSGLGAPVHLTTHERTCATSLTPVRVSGGQAAKPGVHAG